jgi:hypothetical protein
MKLKVLSLFIITYFFVAFAIAQKVQPGFSGIEYRELLTLNWQQYDTSKALAEKKYTRIFRSKEGTLKNRFDIWLSSDSIGIISIRGTTSSELSWLENFYSAMIPATGKITKTNGTIFSYKLAQRSDAMVHVGWVLGLADIAEELIGEIKTNYTKGIKEYIIFGHSQGGALAFYVRSFLEYYNENNFPKDLILKTICSAPPKPGNTYYCYDFDFITRNGYGYRVTNTLDWVPETPLTSQTANDFNNLNPFKLRKEALRKQPIFVRTYANFAYNKMDKASKKSSKMFTKYLGKKTGKIIKKNFPNYVEPAYLEKANYSTAGVPIVLSADEDYKNLFKEEKNIFIHHMYEPYIYLSKKYYP